MAIARQGQGGGVRWSDGPTWKSALHIDTVALGQAAAVCGPGYCGGLGLSGRFEFRPFGPLNLFRLSDLVLRIFAAATKLQD